MNIMILNRFENGVWIVDYNDPDLLNEPIELKIITCHPCKFKLMNKELGEGIMEFIKPLPSVDDMSDELIDSLLTHMKIKKGERNEVMKSYQFYNYHEFISSVKLRRFIDKYHEYKEDEDIDIMKVTKILFKGLNLYVVKYGLTYQLYSSVQFIGDRHPVMAWTLRLIDRWYDKNSDKIG